MSDLTKAIFDIKRSKSFIFYNNYHVGNIFGITKTSRSELMHSNFIAWSLSPNSSHSLHFFPLLQLITSLEFLIKKPDNIKSRLDIDVIRKFYDESFIVDANVKREANHVDILITIKTKEKTLPILIENKVDSPENGKHGDQTKVYFDWGEKEYADKTKYFDPIYIFLFPEYKSKVIQKEEKYIRMTYQELVDNVIEPSMHNCGDMNSKNNYRAYLQCLSFQADNEKGEYSMATSSEERTILDNFIKENKSLLLLVWKKIHEDGDIDDKAFDEMMSTFKDYSTYIFEGKAFSKSRLVLAVVKKYVDDNPSITYSDLKAAFPDNLIGNKKGVIKLDSEVSDKDKGIGGHKRYFVDDPISVGSEKVLVCTQWKKDNITVFIDHVVNKFGYDITKE